MSRRDEGMPVGRKLSTMQAGSGRSLYVLPAVQALLMQCLSLAIVFALVYALFTLFSVRVPIMLIMLLQGICAASLSRWRQLAPWWLLIQLIFFPAIVAGAMLHLPPGIYLLAFLFFVTLYWSTFRTQVPFYPSGSATWTAVEELIPRSRPIRFVDLGSGFGGMVNHLAARRRDSEFIGFELAPLPWLASCTLARLARNPGKFMRADYNRLDLGEFDVVFAYLSPAAMPALWRKACAEMRAGSLLISYEFTVPGAESQITNITVANGRNLYCWTM
jgi:hypothetical protein